MRGLLLDGLVVELLTLSLCITFVACLQNHARTHTRREQANAGMHTHAQQPRSRTRARGWRGVVGVCMAIVTNGLRRRDT